MGDFDEILLSFLAERQNASPKFPFFYAKCRMMSLTVESIGKLTNSKHIFPAFFTIVSMTGKSSQTCFLFFQCFYTVVSYTIGCQLVVSYRTVSYKRGLSVRFV